MHRLYFSDSDLASYILSAKDDAVEEEMCHCCVVYDHGSTKCFSEHNQCCGHKMHNKKRGQNFLNVEWTAMCSVALIV